MLFDDTFEVYAEFANIAGLAERREGARRRAWTPGEVEDDPRALRPGGEVPREAARPRGPAPAASALDSVASIQNDGLVGNKFVQIEAGTDQSQARAGQGHDAEPGAVRSGRHAAEA